MFVHCNFPGKVADFSSSSFVLFDMGKKSRPIIRELPEFASSVDPLFVAGNIIFLRSDFAGEKSIGGEESGGVASEMLFPVERKVRCKS